MTREPGHTGSLRGFTLVELITVMGIIGILIAMIIGAVQAVHDNVAEQNTRGLFAALEGALKSYYTDWNNYPWHDQGHPYPLMGVVHQDYNPLIADAQNFQSNGKEAMLVAALGMTQRKAGGGYLAAAAGQLVMRKAGVGTTTFPLFADGWGRPIRYYPPQMAYLSPIPARSTGVSYDPGLKKNAQGMYQGFPVIESTGRNELDDSDNLVNYGTIKAN